MSHSLIHVYELSVPALLLLIQSEFGADDLQMGQIVTLYGMLFGVGSLPAGLLADRLGANLLLTICLWGASLSMVGMALSPNLWLFTITAALMGASLSIYHPAGTALITHAMPSSGRVFAMHGMAGNSGVAAASVIAGGLGALLGWRWALGGLASLGLLLGLRALRLPGPTADDLAPARTPGNVPRFALLLIAAAFMGMVYRGMTTFLPKFFAVSYADDPSAGTALGGALTTAALIVGLAGMFVAGRISDRGMHPAWVFLIGGIVQIPLLAAIAFSGGNWLVPLAMGVAFFHFFTQPVGNQMVAQFTPPRLRGAGYGLYFFMTFGAGSAGATVGGFVSERIALPYVFPVLASLLVPAVIAVALLGFLSRRVTTPSEETAYG